MKITLDHIEIEQALVNFIKATGIPVDGKKIDVVLITGDELSAAVNISGFVAPLVDNNPVAPALPPESRPAEVDEDLDRETLKKKLDALGVEYAPKTRTPTLNTMLEEAEAATQEPAYEETKQEEPVTENVFGVSANTPDIPGNENPPFDVAPQSVPEEKEEEPDDDRPLFGN